MNLTTPKTKVREVLLRARETAAKVWLSPVRLLIAAAIFHLALTLTIYGVGRYALFPGTFDNNGIGVSFAVDGIQHRADAAALSEVLKRGEVLNWLTATHPLHVKLYSICFALFGPWLGLNIISVEPLNALYYLAILVLVFSLGREAFNRRVGLLAAAAVALWPSFLIHTTQLLKDSLFVVGMLALVLIILRCLTRTYSWPRALLMGAVGGLIAAALWLTRDHMGEIVIAIVLLGAGLLIIRQFGGERVQITNLVGMALLIAMTISAQQVLPKFRKPGRATTSVEAVVRQETLPPRDVGAVAHAPSNEAPPTTPWSRMGARLRTARLRFIMRYPDAGSNLDSNVQLNSTADLIRYLPRAAAIGFFAPFPNMWLAAGKEVGLTGRLLAGLESLAMYAVEGLALFGLWQERRRLPVWLLFLVAVMGMLALGLVVVNVGALFRLRYVFLILVIILGAEGTANMFGRFSKKPGQSYHAHSV